MRLSILIASILYLAPLIDAQTIDPEWVRYHESSTAYAREAPAAVVTADDGTIFVAGTTQLSPFIRTAYLARFDAGGNLAWTAHFSDGRVDASEGLFLERDQDGNLVIAGRIGEVGNELVDILVVKYDPDGNEVWAARHGETDRRKSVRALALDDAGAAYVTGASRGTDGTVDFLTLRVSVGGEVSWVNRLPSGHPTPMTSGGRDVAIVPTGGVAVTGHADGELVTVRYSAEGSLIWQARYDVGLWDEGRFVVSDEGGNLYVAGISRRAEQYPGQPPVIVTMSLDKNGDLRWLREFTLGQNDQLLTGLVLTPQRYLYLSGRTVSWSHGGSIGFVLRYQPDHGTQLWLATYAFDGASVHWLQRLSHTHAGDAVVATSAIAASGHHFAAVRISSGGDVLWTQVLPVTNLLNVVTGLGLGSDDSVVFTGASEVFTTVNRPVEGRLSTLVKLAPSGEHVWTTQTSGSPMPSEEGVLTTVDAAGNVFAIGTRKYLGWNDEAVSVRYTPDGDLAWEAVFNADGSIYNRPHHLGAPGDGSALVLVRSQYPDFSYEHFLIRYHPDGTVAWTLTATEQPFIHGIRDLQAAADGSFYTTGQHGTIRWAPDGSLLWQVVQAGVNHQRIRVGDDGSIYVLGVGGGALHMMRYTSDGDAIWIQQADVPGNVQGELNLTPARDGGAAAVTQVREVGPGQQTPEWFLVRIGADGTLLWTETLPAQHSAPSQPPSMHLAVGSEGETVIAYRHQLTTALVAREVDGTLLWETQFSEPGASATNPHGIRFDDAGHLYLLAGAVAADVADRKFFVTARLDPADGTVQQRARLGDDERTFNQPLGLGLDTNSAVYALGTTSSYSFTTFAMAKYAPGLTETEPVGGTSASITVDAPFPNPFQSEVSIAIALPAGGEVVVTVHDVLGRRVATLAEDHFERGTHLLTWNARHAASGVYVIHVRIADFSSSRKVLRVR